MDELKSCPCCQEAATVTKAIENRGQLFYFIRCSRCSMRSKKQTKWEAINDWNKRPKNESELP